MQVFCVELDNIVVRLAEKRARSRDEDELWCPFRFAPSGGASTSTARHRPCVCARERAENDAFSIERARIVNIFLYPPCVLYTDARAAKHKQAAGPPTSVTKKKFIQESSAPV